MKRRDVLSDCHPLVSAAFFALVLGFSMTQMHPVCLAVSLAGAAGYTAALGGGRALRRAPAPHGAGRDGAARAGV